MQVSVNSVIRWIDHIIRFFLFVLIFWLPYGIAVIEFCVAAGFVLWILKRIILSIDVWKKEPHVSAVLKVWPPKPSALNKPIGLFLVIGFLASLGSVFLSNSIESFFTKFLEWFVIYFLVLEVFDQRKYVVIALGVFLFTSLATAFDGLIQYYVTAKDFFMHRQIIAGDRPTAAFKTPNDLAGYLTLVIPVVLSLFFIKFPRAWFRIALVVLAIVLAWTLWVTATRGAWMGILLSLSLLFFCKQKINFLRYLKVFSILLLISGAVLLALNFQAQRMTTARYNTGEWRLDVWQHSLDMIKERPFLGHGINTFMDLLPYYYPPAKYSPTYAHNCFLQLTVETGILGFLMFGFILYKIFQSAQRWHLSNMAQFENWRWVCVGILAGIFAYLVHSFFDTNLYTVQLSVYFWLWVGVLFVINRFIDQQWDWTIQRKEA